jgi:hypothetical protein
LYPKAQTRFWRMFAITLRLTSMAVATPAVVAAAAK